MADALRDAFEAWLNPGKHAGNVSAWVAPGRYEKDTHQLAWLAWCAALSVQGEPVATDPLHDDAYLRAVALGFPQGDARRWTLCRIADRVEAAAAPAAPAAPAVPQDVQRNANRWLYIAGRWTHADFRWNKDAGNTPKSVTLTVKALPGTGSDGGQLARFIDEAIAAAPSAPGAEGGE